MLGTTVIDRYRFTPRPVLVEEEFEGEGYGLPAAAGQGERLQRLPPAAAAAAQPGAHSVAHPGAPSEPSVVSRGGPRWRLSLNRLVDPLIVRALAEPRMRLLHEGGELLLASLGASAVAISASGCAAGHPLPTP